MFYVVGDASLSGSMISQLKELTDAGFQEDTTVLAFFDPNCNGRNARIFDVNRRRKEEIQMNQQSGTIIGDGRNPFVRDISEDCHIPCLPQLPAAITLRYFLEYSRTYYPAENYLLFLMGHGVVVGNDTFLPDPDDNSSITLTDLGWILRNFCDKVTCDRDKFQLVGFHSCSMNSVELIHDLAGTAKYMMGTQGSALPGSWPYRQLLKKIFGVIEDSRRNDSDDVLQDLLPSLQGLSHYNGEDFWLAGYSADLAICSLDCDKINELNLRIGQLSHALKEGLKERSTTESIQLAHLKSQSYWGENYTDLYDFCDCLSEQCKEGSQVQFAIRSACKDVKDLLTSGKDALVRFSDYYGPAYQYSYGLSIYFPWKAPDPATRRAYANYNFTRNCRADSWWSFLEEYFVATMREPREKEGWKLSQPQPAITSPRWHVTDWLRTLSDGDLLSLSPYGPPDKVLGLDPPGKVLGLDPPGKVLGVDPPGKVLGVDPPGKVLGVDPPDKVLGLDPPGKVLGLDPPGKVLGIDPPGKVLGIDPPGKVLGLFGFSVIKNFYAPDDIFVTSRPQGFQSRKNQAPQNGMSQRSQVRKSIK
jgi:hypothetical protein